eukprot:gene16365-22306_t
MQGTGKTYEISGQTTEWEDILIKKGITTKEDVLLGKGLNPEDFLEKPDVIEEIEYDKLELKNLKELDDLEDDDEYSDSRILNEYRQRRLQELKEKSLKNRFGELVEIVKDDWIREVTESSKSCHVVVHLYENFSVGCQLIDEATTVLAAKFKYVKFLKIKSTQAVENWPEQNLPTLFIYENGALKAQMMTLKEVYGTTMKANDLEWFLVKKGVITDSELDEDPRGELASNMKAKGLVQKKSNYDYDNDSD